MWQEKKPRFRQSLTLAAMICLSSCATTSYSCPVYPVAGEKVAAELEKADHSDFPNTWEWIGRIDKLRQELEICQ